MSKFRITNTSTIVRSGPYRPDSALRRWLTTADTAKELHLSRWRVLQLVESGDLPSELTRSGQRIYHLADVRRLRDHRADRHARTREDRLRDVRCRVLKAAASGEARQLTLDFSRRLWLVGSRQKGRQVA